MGIVPSSDEVSWFCLKTQPKREHIASAHLRQMEGVEVFSPRLRFKRPTKRGARWFHEAMFPGYLFARFHFAQRCKEVQSAMGITQIVRFGKQCATVAEPVIEGLRAHAGPNEIALVNYEIKEGDIVKVVEGSLGGLEAVVTCLLSGRERVQILLEFLGREIRAELKSDAILPATRHPLSR